MLEEMGLYTETVFVQLLDEGTVVFRPVPAIRQEDGTYILSKTADYDPEFESWQFVPGSRVVCELGNAFDQTALIAVSQQE